MSELDGKCSFKDLDKKGKTKLLRETLKKMINAKFSDDVEPVKLMGALVHVKKFADADKSNSRRWVVDASRPV